MKNKIYLGMMYTSRKILERFHFLRDALQSTYNVKIHSYLLPTSSERTEREPFKVGYNSSEITKETGIGTLLSIFNIDISGDSVTTRSKKWKRSNILVKIVKNAITIGVY